MPVSLLPTSKNIAVMQYNSLPPAADDIQPIVVQFVRALAIRQARLDVSQTFKAANDNERRTLH
jgi:hypothetical protein